MAIRGHGFLQQSTGVFTTIDFPGSSTYTVAFGVDAQGRTVGGYVDARGRTHGFLQKQKGILIPIDVPGAGATFATRLNVRGDIVGLYGSNPNTPASDLPHGFLLDNGIFRRIDVPGAVATRPFGINDSGDIVGEYVDQTGLSHGFLLHQGQYQTLDSPGSTSTRATDIDDNGRIVGIAFNSQMGTTRGFLRDAQGTFTPVDAPASPAPAGLPGPPTTPKTQVFGINNRGQMIVVGIDPEGVHSYVLDNGVFTKIEVPGAIRTTLAFDISDDGRVAGAFNVTVTHGIIGDPQGGFTYLDHPDAVEETVLTGINNRGQIAATIADAAGNVHGAFFDDGRFSFIDVPGALGTTTSRLNDRGGVVGSFSVASGNGVFTSHGYLWQRGIWTQIDCPDAIDTIANDVDNQGRVVGTYVDAKGGVHGFRRETGGKLTTIDVQGALATSLEGTNDHGALVGVYTDVNLQSHGFVLDNGVLTNIDFPNAARTIAIDINNRGEVVGGYFDDTRSYGFIWQGGKFSTFGAPGAFVVALTLGLNDQGRVVGSTD